MPKKVPHCENCNVFKMRKFLYKSFYCYHASFDNVRLISNDNPPKTSPKWCPLR